MVKVISSDLAKNGSGMATQNPIGILGSGGMYTNGVLSNLCDRHGGGRRLKKGHISHGRGLEVTDNISRSSIAVHMISLQSGNTSMCIMVGKILGCKGNWSQFLLMV